MEQTPLGLHERSREAAQCPYCHAHVGEQDRTWACPGCGTIHHEDCARENRRCTLLGCAREVTVPEVRDGVPLPPVDPSAVEVRRNIQDPLVLLVSVGSIGGLALMGSIANLTQQRRPGGVDLTWFLLLCSLVLVALLGALMAWARRRDRGEDL